MRNTETNKIHKGYAFAIVLGITIVAFFALFCTAVAVAATDFGPLAYITNSADNNVSIIDTATNNVTATINVGRLPFGVAVNPNGKKVYVANYLSNNVSIIDTTSNTVTSSIDVGTLPFGIAVNPQGTRVYVANYLNNTISVINTSAESVIATVDVQKGPCELAVSPDGNKVYVTSLNSKNISIIDTVTNVTATLNVGSPTFGVAVTPDGNKIYVTNANSSTVSTIDATTNTITATIPVGTMPWGIAVNPQGTKVYVANSESNSVSVINTSTNTVIATVNVGSLPCGIAVNPQGTKVYVANSDSNNVSVIDAATNNVTATVNVGSLPVAFGQFIVSLSPALPVANFSSNVSSGYVPLAVEFTDISKNVTEWNWTFGDGANSTVQNPTHTYSTAGNYIVTLIVSNENGTDAKSRNIVVLNNVTIPATAFTASPTLGSAPLNVSFTDVSTGIPTSWKWQFGDYTNSTDQNPVHTYSKPGLYSVAFEASNARGTSSVIKSNYITVSNNASVPAVAFTASSTFGNAPLNISFADASTGSPTSWKWYFGDGEISTDQNPVHTYSKPGLYSLALSVNSAGGTNSVNKSGYITVFNNVSIPVAAFTASPTFGSAPLNVSFTDASTGSPTSWKWQFGDYTNSTSKNPVHTFSKPGIYTITLTASNEGGSSSVTKSNYIIVSNNASVPVAAFSASPNFGSSPLNVSFNDSSSGSPGSWKWNFGDGTKSTDQNPTHTFSIPGVYSVSLVASNVGGSCVVTKSGYIIVSNNVTVPVAAFSVSPTFGSAPFNVSFTDTSMGSPTSWKWNFGDNTNSTDQNPMHTFRKAGLYTIGLTVANSGGSGAITINKCINVT